ncbi:MAG: hypothetical protein FGM14_08120 [Flavobacteriales bacterium]|nr:hypothetical protein [Flavobacteriales bacterium]
MKCSIHVYLINELYSQEFADEFHNGNPSEDNKEFDWEDELSISSDVVSTEELSNSVYKLEGENGNGDYFSVDVPNMRLVKISSSDAPDVFVGVSESMLDAVSLEKLTDEFLVSIYIKDNEPHANPIPGIYIASKEFPKELI